MNILLVLDSFSLRTFSHELDILSKYSRRSEQVKGSFGVLNLDIISVRMTINIRKMPLIAKRGQTKY